MKIDYISKYFSYILTLNIFLITIFFSSNVMSQVFPADAKPETDLNKTREELNVLRQELDKREVDLNEREIQLNALQSSIVEREKNILNIRGQVDDKLKELEGVKDNQIDRLVELYSATKPKQAANILVSTDINITSSIFKKLQPKVAGKILNEMGKLDADYASRLTDLLHPKTTPTLIIK